jgi:hypothetical protein
LDVERPRWTDHLTTWDARAIGFGLILLVYAASRCF